MAVAAPARKTAPAPAPSRTSPPKKAAPARPAPQKKAAPARQPRTRPKPKGRAAASAAPARTAPARRAPARKAPTRAPRRTKTKRAVGGQLIPLASRTAVAVGQLPDSGLMVRMTRGRVWIGVLGLLLVGIVALNVVTLSFAASTGDIDANITALEQENPVLKGRVARDTGIGQVRQAAASLGLAMPSSETVQVIESGPDDVATAAQRLAAISPG